MSEEKYTFNCASCGQEGDTEQNEECPVCGELEAVIFDEILVEF
jgi:rubrerythrin